MRIRFGRTVASLLLFAATYSNGQSNGFEMPMLGRSLPVAKYKLVNLIPSAHAKRLPKTLPVFRYSAKPRDFSVAGLQTLLDKSVFVGTNFASLLHGHTNVALIDEPVRLATARNLDYFFVDPLGGGIVSYNQDKGVDFRKDTPAYDAVPSFESIRDSVFRYARMFGVSTNEMERKNDGSILLRKTDDKTVARGGAIKFISRRSVEVFRNVAGYTFLGSDD